MQLGLHWDAIELGCKVLLWSYDWLTSRLRIAQPKMFIFRIPLQFKFLGSKLRSNFPSDIELKIFISKTSQPFCICSEKMKNSLSIIEEQLEDIFYIFNEKGQ